MRQRWSQKNRVFRRASVFKEDWTKDNLCGSRRSGDDRRGFAKLWDIRQRACMKITLMDIQLGFSGGCTQIRAKLWKEMNFFLLTPGFNRVIRHILKTRVTLNILLESYGLIGLLSLYNPSSLGTCENMGPRLAIMPASGLLAPSRNQYDSSSTA